ncbi:MAG: hypothetical protein WCF55_14420, partial [Pseudolabrys sp.]
RTIKTSDLGELKCSDITSQALVSFAKQLTQNIEPQTCGNYFSHLSNIFTVARHGDIRSPGKNSTTPSLSLRNSDLFEKAQSETVGLLSYAIIGPPPCRCKRLSLLPCFQQGDRKKSRSCGGKTWMAIEFSFAI